MGIYWPEDVFTVGCRSGAIRILVKLPSANTYALAVDGGITPPFQLKHFGPAAIEARRSAFDIRSMLKVLLAAFLFIVLWIAISISMMWPPVCRYGGKDALRGVQSVFCINNLRQIDGAKQMFALET